MGFSNDLEEKLVRIVEFRVNAGLTDSPQELVQNLVDGLVEVGLVSPEDAEDLVNDVLAAGDDDDSSSDDSSSDDSSSDSGSDDSGNDDDRSS